MGEFFEILWPVLIFAGLGLVFGVVLAIASKVFFVKTEESVAKITEVLPGANCGGCGYAGCAQLAQAIADGKAPVTACTAGGPDVANKIAEVLGVEVGEMPHRMRAQVMCSGTGAHSQRKYIYAGVKDCIAAAKLGGGDRVCPNGCTGLGTCVAACKFEAISVIDGVAVVDYKKCEGCGACVAACPKHIIKLMPYNSEHWVGCMSVDKGAVTRKYCDVGCIACKICEKACPEQAITVNDFKASIDYDKCIGCGVCVEKCPRHIIWSAEVQNSTLVIKRETKKETEKVENK